MARDAHTVRLSTRAEDPVTEARSCEACKVADSSEKFCCCWLMIDGAAVDVLHEGALAGNAKAQSWTGVRSHMVKTASELSMSKT